MKYKPEHWIQIKIPKFKEIHSGSGVPQSAQRLLPDSKDNLTNSGFFSFVGFEIICESDKFEFVEFCKE